jgi:hypothetical protein
MPEIDDAAVLKRAKQLCEQDDRLWDDADRQGRYPIQKIKFVLHDEERRHYLARARQQLEREAGNA